MKSIDISGSQNFRIKLGLFVIEVWLRKRGITIKITLS